MIPAELLLEAYAQGVFPMAMENGELGWFSPNPRGILPLDAFHLPHGLARTLKKKKFTIRFNHDFETVIRACAVRPDVKDGNSTWIDANIIASYTELHRRGHAHSVEAWSEEGLAGGLYGVSLGGTFFGESMFHYETDASKIALVALVDHLNEQGFQLLDTQWITPHLATFGAIEIPRKTYLRRLHASLKLDCKF